MTAQLGLSDYVIIYVFDILNLYLHHHVSAEIILVQQFFLLNRLSYSSSHPSESVIVRAPYHTI